MKDFFENICIAWARFIDALARAVCKLWKAK